MCGKAGSSRRWLRAPTFSATAQRMNWFKDTPCCAAQVSASCLSCTGRFNVYRAMGAVLTSYSHWYGSITYHGVYDSIETSTRCRQANTRNSLASGNTLFSEAMVTLGARTTLQYTLALPPRGRCAVSRHRSAVGVRGRTARGGAHRRAKLALGMGQGGTRTGAGQ